MPDANAAATTTTAPATAAAAAPNATAPAINGAFVGPANNAVVPPVPSVPDSKLPTRKDTSLKEFVNKMDDYAPIVCLFFF